METKICTKCDTPKLFKEFGKGNDKHELNYWCRECCKKINKEYHKNNPIKNTKEHTAKTLKWQKNNPKKVKQYRKTYQEKNKERKKEYNKEYNIKNAAKIKKYRRAQYILNSEKQIEEAKSWRKNNVKRSKQTAKKYRIKNKKKIKESLKQYKKENRDKIRKYQKNYNRKRRKDPIHKLNNVIRIGIWESLKKNKNGEKWEKLVGYSLNDLKIHLEKQFKDGMTWENHSRDGWHIDHRIPISLFNITSAKCKGFKKCWELSNLQPLWAKENMKKNNRLFQ